MSTVAPPAEETFHFMAWGFDITAVRAILAKKTTPEQRGVVSVAEFGRFLESDPLLTPPAERRVPLMGVEVQWSQVDELSSDALTAPLFLASLGAIGSFVIDGWHRIALARRHGIEQLPAVQLTRRQTQRVLLPRSAPLPPEKTEG